MNGSLVASPHSPRVSADSGGDRHSERRHPVEHVAANLCLGPLIGQSPGSGANKLRGAPGNAGVPATSVLLRCQRRIPDGRRTSTVEAQAAEVELSLPDPAQQFNTGK
jgi:hypothetical protein